MPTIPAEVLELFVDRIDNSPEGWKALCTCMLVSKLFFLRSRSSIFSSIELNEESVLGDFKKLLEYQYISHAPLGTCIRNLTINFSDRQDTSKRDKLDILVLLAATASRIQTLELGLGFREFPGHELYHPFRNICTLPTLKSLTLLYATNFPIEMFDIFQLENLHTGFMSFRHSHPTENTGLSVKIHEKKTAQLKSYTARYTDNLPAEWLESMSTSPFSKLRFLAVILDGGSAPLKLNNLLTVAQRTLETLRIHLTYNSIEEFPHSLQPLTALRRLIYVVDAPTFDHRTPENLFDWATTPILQSLGTLKDVPSTLQHLAIFFSVNSWHINVEEIRFGDDQKRRELLGALSSPRFASSLAIDLIIQVTSLP